MYPWSKANKPRHSDSMSQRLQSEQSICPSLQQHGFTLVPASQSVPASQCHHEPLMSTSAAQEPLSAYALWKIEEDEKFYATFPQARFAAEQYANYYGSPHYYYDVDSITGYMTETPSQDHSTSYSYDHGTGQAVAQSSALHYDYNVAMQATVPSTTPSSSLLHAVPPFRRDCATRRGGHDHHSSQFHNSFPLTTPTQSHRTYTPSVEIIQSTVIIPSHHRYVNGPLTVPSLQQEEPHMDHLQSPVSPSSTSSSFMPSTPPDSYKSQDNKKPSSSHYTYPSPGNWSAHEHVNDYHQSRSEGSEPPQISLLHDLHGPHRHSRSSRPPHDEYASNISLPRPAGWAVVRTPSPRGIRLSPLPTSKRPLPRKPPLACLFCRGRKIACGAPDPGSSDRTCNQCQRRSIKCEYPLESRRGMRKKKTPAVNLNTAGPKVKLGRKPKAPRVQ